MPEPENRVFSGFCQILSRLEGVLTGVSGGGKVEKGDKGKGQNYDRENVLEAKIQERLKVSNNKYICIYCVYAFRLCCVYAIIILHSQTLYLYKQILHTQPLQLYIYTLTHTYTLTHIYSYIYTYTHTYSYGPPARPPYPLFPGSLS